MEKSHQIKNQLKELCIEEDNSCCFDCGNKPANWASISNGIFLCLDCSSEHRSYGINISFIRSVNLDKWTQEQVNIMKVGGNKRLKDFLTKYDMPENIDKKIIYTSHLMNFYRNQLKAESMGQFNMHPFPSKEEFWTAINLSEESMNNLDNNSKNEIKIDINQYQYARDKSENLRNSFEMEKTQPELNNINIINNEERYGSVGSGQDNNLNNKLTSYMDWLPFPQYFDDIKKIINNANGAASNNNNQEEINKNRQELKNNLLSLGNKTFGGMNYIGGKIIEKGIDIIKSDTMKNIFRKTGQGLWYIKDKIFGSRNNDNDNNRNNEIPEEETYSFIEGENPI